MSEDGKKPSLRGFGVRRRWMPGVEIKSEAEYIKFTKQLTQELMSELSHEDVAVIAAQHMMFSDLLSRSLDESRNLNCVQTAVSDVRLESSRAHLEVFTRDWARYTVAVLNAYKKKAWGAGGKAKNAKTNEIRPLILKEWDEKGHEYNSRIDFGRIVSRRDGVNVGADTVRDWIKDHLKSKV